MLMKMASSETARGLSGPTAVKGASGKVVTSIVSPASTGMKTTSQ